MCMWLSQYTVYGYVFWLRKGSAYSSRKIKKPRFIHPNLKN